MYVTGNGGRSFMKEEVVSIRKYVYARTGLKNTEKTYFPIKFAAVKMITM